MERTRKLLITKVIVVMSAIPFLIWAHEYGPDPGHCNVPGELGTCNQATCHVGPPAVNGGSGSVSVSFPGGKSFTPGVKQHLIVTIADPAQRAWGFQLTARPANSNSTMAGTFASTDPNTTILCSNTSFFSQLETPYVPGKTQTCPASLTLSYIEQSLTGYNSSRGKTASQTFEFDWTPPSSAAANVVIYVAGNAANGDLQPTGDHIYTATYTLTPVAANPPSILPNGVVSAGAFGGFTSVAPGSWMEIFGANLSPTTRGWAGSDFKGSQAPTSLDNVKVTIGGKDAFIDYISPGQVNAQVPSDTPTGAQQMTVTNPAGASSNYPITVNPLQPGLLAPSSFLVGGKQYVVAQFQDGTFVLPPNAISGVASRQAKPGETITIYGVGFGPVVDGNNQSISAGTIVGAANKLTNSFSMTFGTTSATLGYAGLAPSFVGLYQFNVVVPNVPNNDLVPLSFSLNGATGSQTLFTAVHN
jgi:uncharacterized protein (TIGR03437 family)